MARRGVGICHATLRRRGEQLPRSWDQQTCMGRVRGTLILRCRQFMHASEARGPLRPVPRGAGVAVTSPVSILHASCVFSGDGFGAVVFRHSTRQVDWGSPKTEAENGLTPPPTRGAEKGQSRGSLREMMVWTPCQGRPTSMASITEMNSTVI